MARRRARPPARTSGEGEAKGEVFTGETLLEAIEEGSFDRPGVDLVGMVKASEKDDHVSFTSGNCEEWVDLPTSMIERAEHVGHRPCKDHSHPVFRITLKEPEDPGAKLLAALLSARSGARARRSAPILPRGRGFGHPMMAPRFAASRRPWGPTQERCWDRCNYVYLECSVLGGSGELCAWLFEACFEACEVIDPIFENVFA